MSTHGVGRGKRLNMTRASMTSLIYRVIAICRRYAFLAAALPLTATTTGSLLQCKPNLQIRAMSLPLTTHLTSLSTPRPYSAATEHAFLTAAGTGTLPPALLSLYLSQDRLYAAHAYPRFLGHLLTHVPFSSRHAPDSPEERLHGEIVDVLAGALQNVRREVGLFAEVQRAHSLPPFAQWRERKATRDYTAEMARVGAFGTLEDGLVFLWAMERVCQSAIV